MSARADAVGGDGGNAGIGAFDQNNVTKARDGKAGAGGFAGATARSTNNAGNTTATANASGGDGGALGDNASPRIGTAGSSIAIATATASGDARALPFAETGLGRGGLAVAFGRAVGGSGAVSANGFGVNTSSVGRAGKVRSARAVADAPIPAGGMGAVEAQAQGAIAASAPMLKPNTELNAFASAIGDPSLDDVLATSAGKPNVVTGLEVGQTDNQLGLMWLGGLYPDAASGAQETFSSSASFTIDPSEIMFGELKVGLQDGMATGNGFDALDFRIIVNGLLMAQQEFTTLGEALAYFDDKVLSLGNVFADASGFLNIEFDLAVTGHNLGDGFAIDLALASVPEPNEVALVGLGLGLVVFQFGRRQRFVKAELH
jgi:hypothetical protein